MVQTGITVSVTVPAQAQAAEAQQHQQEEAQGLDLVALQVQLIPEGRERKAAVYREFQVLQLLAAVVVVQEVITEAEAADLQMQAEEEDPAIGLVHSLRPVITP